MTVRDELREKIARTIDEPNWRVRDAGGLSYSSAVKFRTERSLRAADAILAIPTIKEALGLSEWVGEPAMYARDLDGTGSLHVCAEGDPGAIPLYR